MTDQRTPVRSYSTNFELDEDPISEGGMWLNGRKDGIDWIDVISKNGEAFGAVSRMGVAGAPRRAGQPRVRGSRPDRRLRRSDRGAHGRMGQEPARQGHGLQPEPDGRLLPGSPDPPAPHDDAEQLHRLRGVLALPQDRGRLRGDRALGRRDRRLVTSLQRRVGAEYGVEDGDVIEATIEGNVLKGFINGVEVISADDDATTRARRASASTSASATPTSTTDSRRSRSTPTTTERSARARARTGA